MQTQLSDPGRTDPIWRRQCEFNLRLARQARASLGAAVQCIASVVKEMEKSRRVEITLRDRERAREDQEKRRIRHVEEEQKARESKEARLRLLVDSAESDLQKLKKYFTERHGKEFWLTTLIESGVLKQIKETHLEHVPEHLHSKIQIIPS